MGTLPHRLALARGVTGLAARHAQRIDACSYTPADLAMSPEEESERSPQSDPSGDARDPLLFSELLRSGRSRVFGYLLALVQNLADAEDLYQQTALLLWEKFDQYQKGTDFSTWATTVAHYTALNFLRRQSRRRQLFSEAALERLSDVQAELKSSDSAARSEALARCIESLSARDRRLLRMRYDGERTVSEIAAQESRTVGSIYTALSRIRKSLIACIQRRLPMEAT